MRHMQASVLQDVARGRRTKRPTWQASGARTVVQGECLSEQVLVTDEEIGEIVGGSVGDPRRHK